MLSQKTQQVIKHVFAVGTQSRYMSSGIGAPMTSFAERDLTGRKLLVTGANRGLGREMAKQLAARGASVIIAGRSASKIEKAAEEIVAETSNHSVHPVVADFGNRKSIAAMMHSIESTHDYLNGIVLNASIMPGFDAHPLEVPDELEADCFRINIDGYHFTTKSPTDFERTVLYVSGLAGAMTHPPHGFGMMAYSATLAAENSLMSRLYMQYVTDDDWAVKLRGGSKAPEHKLQRVASLHPGIVATGLGFETAPPGVTMEQVLAKKRDMGFVDEKEGVDTMLWLMTAQDGVVESGKFYNLRKPTDF